MVHAPQRSVFQAHYSVLAPSFMFFFFLNEDTNYPVLLLMSVAVMEPSLLHAQSCWTMFCSSMLSFHMYFQQCIYGCFIMYFNGQ